MYSYLDYDNNRHRLRDRFAEEMHKKTSLKDIGEKLDEFILDSKAQQLEYWHNDKHLLEMPDKPQQNLEAAEFDWKANLLASFDPLKPQWLDD